MTYLRRRDERILEPAYMSREGSTGTTWWVANRGRKKLTKFVNGAIVGELGVERAGQQVFSDAESRVYLPNSLFTGTPYNTVWFDSANVYGEGISGAVETLSAPIPSSQSLVIGGYALCFFLSSTKTLTDTATGGVYVLSEFISPAYAVLGGYSFGPGDIGLLYWSATTTLRFQRWVNGINTVNTVISRPNPTYLQQQGYLGVHVAGSTICITWNESNAGDAIGYAVVASSSDGGVSFTTRYSSNSAGGGASNYRNINYGGLIKANGYLWVSIGQRGTGAPAVIRSSDGVTWLETAMPYTFQFRGAIFPCAEGVLNILGQGSWANPVVITPAGAATAFSSSVSVANLRFYKNQVYGEQSGTSYLYVTSNGTMPVTSTPTPYGTIVGILLSVYPATSTILSRAP